MGRPRKDSINPNAPPSEYKKQKERIQLLESVYVNSKELIDKYSTIRHVEEVTRLKESLNKFENFDIYPPTLDIKPYEHVQPLNSIDLSAFNRPVIKRKRGRPRKHPLPEQDTIE